jgi:hypothetical protein
MCGICIAGLCIPYPALLPMVIFALQWTMAQLARVGLKLPGVAVADSHTSKDSSENSPQHRIENNACDDLWCFCKRLTRMARKGSSGSSSVASTDSSSSEGSDSESDDGEGATDQPGRSRRQLDVAPTLERPTRRNQKMRKTRMNLTPSFIPGEWCLPCTEILK